MDIATADTQPKNRVALTINGNRQDLEIHPWVTLLDLLRGPLHLTGTKKGCDHGQCGACTVLVDGERVNSCLKFAVTLDGAEITTIEGLGTPDDMHAMQKAFVEHDAYQCGYCTPGQICSAVGLLAEGRAKSREEIREMMSGNICRCGAYVNIADAIDQNARGPKRVRVGSHEVEQHSVQDQIAADQHAKAQTAAGKVGFGLRFAKLKPPEAG